ncbi:SDR family oxidoreductase [Opitutales bacterium]|nr:SDR family oxidoreductase [Opitutales bacterium]MDA8990582.1 SDR family oxidoreductase [Opitutales bacterium]
MSKLHNQVAIVTGGGKGIGKAISTRFAKEGAKVAIWEADPAAGEATAKEITDSGHQAQAFLCDITAEESILTALTSVTRDMGKPEILINNAGIANVGTATTTSVEDFDKIMEVNAKGMFLCLKHVLPIMEGERSGVVLNLASIASRLGIADRFAYSASKGAVLAMTLSVARDFVDHGIRCNCLCPGRVHTPFVDGFLKKYYPEENERNEKFDELSKYQPIGRMGEPHEIANIATFLCSEEASFITGGAYDIDGGVMSLK